jgi:hypothetical protein
VRASGDASGESRERPTADPCDDEHARQRDPLPPQQAPRAHAQERPGQRVEQPPILETEVPVVDALHRVTREQPRRSRLLAASQAHLLRCSVLVVRDLRDFVDALGQPVAHIAAGQRRERIEIERRAAMEHRVEPARELGSVFAAAAWQLEKASRVVVSAAIAELVELGDRGTRRVGSRGRRFLLGRRRGLGRGRGHSGGEREAAGEGEPEHRNHARHCHERSRDDTAARLLARTGSRARERGMRQRWSTHACGPICAVPTRARMPSAPLCSRPWPGPRLRAPRLRLWSPVP